MYGIIGSLVIAPPSVVRAQELIRELNLLKKATEELATENLLKSKGAKRANVLVSSVVCNAICKTLCICIIELPLYMDTQTYFVLKFIM